MEIYRVTAGPLRANSYLLTEDGISAVLIDCGGKEPLDFAKKKGLKIEYVLLTHGHFDHIGGCAALSKSGAKIGCCKTELPLITSADGNLSSMSGVSIEPFGIDFTFADGDVLNFCGMRFTVLATPGHTPGGVCFQCKDCLFTGDTLFCESVGRSDFPGGDSYSLLKSVKKLLNLPNDCTVYPGHEDTTTLEHERINNPFL